MKYDFPCHILIKNDKKHIYRNDNNYPNKKPNGSNAQVAYFIHHHSVLLTDVNLIRWRSFTQQRVDSFSESIVFTDQIINHFAFLRKLDLFSR